LECHRSCHGAVRPGSHQRQFFEPRAEQFPEPGNRRQVSVSDGRRVQRVQVTRGQKLRDEPSLGEFLPEEACAGICEFVLEECLGEGIG
jgi:hypothetical protein